MAHPSIIINGVVYPTVPEVDIPISGGGTAKFFDASNATVVASHVLGGDVFIGASGEGTGSMTDNGSVGGEIETKAGTVNIPSGFTSGGTVGIKSSAVTDLIAANLLAGKTVLGVAGTLAVPVISQDATSKILSIS